MGKKVKVILLSSVFCMMVMASVIVCNAGTLVISQVTQERDRWCWAACAEMVGRWNYGSHSQSDIVSYVKGSVVNEYGNIDEATLGTAYASNFDGEFINGGKFVESSVKYIINTWNEPIIAGLRGNWGAGHMVVIHGYNDGDLYICDPADGSSTWVSYDTLSNSYYGKHWAESVYEYKY